MKEVIYIKDFIDLEREYMKQHNPYLIEEALLYSYPKKELKELVEATKESYLREKLPYSSQLQRERIKQNYPELDDLSKYLVDMISYYFSGGEEIELTKKFLDRLQRFYRLNYIHKYEKKKDLDINKIPIREILSWYCKVPDNLRRNMRCIFPDHRDRSASMKVYENNNSFYCFGCHRGGNVLNLISEMEGITTTEAYKKLLQLYSNY